MSSTIAQASLTREQFEIQHDQTVRTEIETFRERAAAFLAGQITENEFRPFRLKHGIYGQRQAGVQMVRCKIPAGCLRRDRRISSAASPTSSAAASGHLTTRQNIQYHFVPLDRVPDLMHMLADVGPDQSRSLLQHRPQRDRLPLGRPRARRSLRRSPLRAELAYAFLRKDLTGNLPRKFKIRLRRLRRTGLHSGRHQRRRPARGDSRRQARLPHDRSAAVSDRCRSKRSCSTSSSPRSVLIHKCEAVLRVFNQYGNRQEQEQSAPEVRDARARLRLAEGADRKGISRHPGQRRHSDRPKWSRRASAAINPSPQPLGNGALLPVVNAAHSGRSGVTTPGWKPTSSEQKQTGYATVTVSVDQGNLTGDQLRGLARIAPRPPATAWCASPINQNVVLAFIPAGAPAAGLTRRLGDLGLASAGAQRDRRRDHLPRRLHLQPRASPKP